MKFLSKLILKLFLIEGSDIYQLLLVPWKNIVPSRSYRRSIARPEIESKFLFSPTFFEQSS